MSMYEIEINVLFLLPILFLPYLSLLLFLPLSSLLAFPPASPLFVRDYSKLGRVYESPSTKARTLHLHGTLAFLAHKPFINPHLNTTHAEGPAGGVLEAFPHYR